MQNRSSPQMSRNSQDFAMAGVLQNAGTTLPSLRLTSKRKTSSTTRPYVVRQLGGVGVWAGAQPGRSNGAGPWAWKSLGQAGINPPPPPPKTAARCQAHRKYCLSFLPEKYEHWHLNGCIISPWRDVFLSGIGFPLVSYFHAIVL